MIKIKKGLLFLLGFLLSFNLVASGRGDLVSDGGDAEVSQYTETTVFIEVPKTATSPAHRIPAIVTMPANRENVPAVVMLHGTGSDKTEAGGGYELAAFLMALEGIATIRFDMMGSGESTASYTDYNYESALADAIACANFIKELTGVNSSAIGIMGWSQGGTLALLAAARYSDVFSSAVTWAASVDLGGIFTDFTSAYKTAKADGFVELPFTWRASLNVGFEWFDQVATTDVLKEVGDSSVPILAIHGDVDSVVPMSDSVSIAKASTLASFYIVEGADHTFNIFDPTDEQRTIVKAINKTIEFFKDNLQ